MPMSQDGCELIEKEFSEEEYEMLKNGCEYVD